MSYSQSGNIVTSSSGSRFTPSELDLIQAGKWLPELSHFVPVTSPRNLDDNLNHARDEGEKIDLLIHTALNPHAPALIGLGEFLNSRDLTVLAATLRGFASIGETLKQQNLDPNYRHHLEQLRYVLRDNLDLNDDENPSVHLFKRLCHDAESGGSEMVRWAAAHALQELDYPLNLRRQLLSRPPAEILAEIWRNYESRLSDQKRENDPSKVLEDIKFGIYGHTEKLFSESRRGYFLSIVSQVLRKSGMRGIRLALEYGDRTVLVEAVNFAGELFNQINPNSQDKRYKNKETRQRLADLLLPFLTITDLDLRNQFAERLNDKHNQYDVSNYLLDKNNRAKVAVIDTDWNRVISLGDLAVPVLRETVEGKLRIENEQNLNINCQIEAVKTIDTILTDIPQKIIILAPYLQHDNDRTRLLVANLLKPHKKYLDLQSTQIISALLFHLDIPCESNISLSNRKLNQSNVEGYIKLAESLRLTVQDVFANAISACDSKSTATKKFISQQQKVFLERITKYLDDLDIWLQDHDDDQQRKANAKEDRLKREKLCKSLMEKKIFIKARIDELSKDIESTENIREGYSRDIKRLFPITHRHKKNHKLLLYCIFILPLPLGSFLFTLLILLRTITEIPIAISIFALIWCGSIFFTIFNIFATKGAKVENDSLVTLKTQARRKIIAWEKERDEQERKLNIIESSIRENKCR